MKIKIIADQVSYSNGIVSYVNAKEKHFEQKKSISIETEVNKFCSKKDIVVHSITPSISVIGNNPPTPVMVYTIVYDDVKE